MALSLLRHATLVGLLLGALHPAPLRAQPSESAPKPAPDGSAQEELQIDEEESVAPSTPTAPEATPPAPAPAESTPPPAPAAPKVEASAKPDALRPGRAEGATAPTSAAAKTGAKQWLPPWLKLAGLIQGDGVLWDQSSVDELDPATREPLNQNRFLVRRAWFRIALEQGLMQGSMTVDVNTVEGPTARILTGEVGLRGPWGSRELPWVATSLGLMRIPFGFEVPERVSERLILEPSNMTRAFFPGLHDAGARIYGGWRVLRYAVAAMNGNPLSENSQFRARDPNKSKDLLGRIGIDATTPRGMRWIGGVSALVGQGFHAGTPPTKDELVWRDANEDGLVQNNELQVLAGVPATASENFRRFALGGDLRATLPIPYLGGLTLYGEAVWAQNLDRGLQVSDPVAAGRDLRQFGWYLGFTQELTRHALLGLRYDRYDPDMDATDELGADLLPKDASYTTLALAAAWRYREWGRVVLQYDHNTNPLGRSASGSIETLRSDRLTLRMQVAY